METLKVILLANWGLGLEVLKVLHQHDHVDIELVVSQYDRNSTDAWKNVVYAFAVSQNYNVMDQNKISLKELREIIVSRDIDLLISHSFMKILPLDVLEAPKRGSINIHASLLPKYRGPSPTYWVLKNSEKETGLTCHYMDEGVDTGNIIYQEKVPVESGDTVEAVIEKQKRFVGKLITESLARLRDSHFTPIVQQSENATYAPRPT